MYRHIFMMLFRVSFGTRVCSRLAVGSSDRRVGNAFVRVSVWVVAYVCMRFCMFVSAFVMRSSDVVVAAPPFRSCVRLPSRKGRPLLPAPHGVRRS